MSEELVEKVAERIWDETSGVFTGQWEEQGDFKKARVREMAAAAIPVVLDAVREVVESERLEETEDPFATNLSVTGRAADRAYNRALDDVLSGLSIGSLGAEGGSPE